MVTCTPTLDINFPITPTLNPILDPSRPSLATTLPLLLRLFRDDPGDSGYLFARQVSFPFAYAEMHPLPKGAPRCVSACFWSRSPSLGRWGGCVSWWFAGRLVSGATSHGRGGGGAILRRPAARRKRSAWYGFVGRRYVGTCVILALCGRRPLQSQVTPLHPAQVLYILAALDSHLCDHLSTVVPARHQLDPLSVWQTRVFLEGWSDHLTVNLNTLPVPPFFPIFFLVALEH